MDTIVQLPSSVQKPASRGRPSRRRSRRGPPLRWWAAASRRPPAKPLAGGGGGPPPSTPAPPARLSQEDADWLETLRPWAKAITRRNGVRAADAEDAVQEAFSRAATEWAAFVPPPEVPARSARRRWITGHLLRAARRVQSAGGRVRAREVPDDAIDEAHTAESHEGAVSAREVLRTLEQTTSPERWRAWIAHEVDGVPIGEIARQEGRTRATIYNLLRLAREDFAAALDRRAAAEHASIRPRGKRRT